MTADDHTLPRRVVLAGGLLGATGLATDGMTHATFSDTETDEGRFEAGTWSGSDRVAFTQDGSLTSAVDGEPVEDHSPTGVEVVGSPTELLDGEYSIPFYGNSSEATDALQYVDDDGTVAVLETGETTVRTQGSIVATASWDGSPDSVFYANEDEETIYRIAPGESKPTEVATLGNGATAVLGVGDVDGDGNEELVYVDGSAVVRYLGTDDETGDNIGDVGENNNVGAGGPASFPEYGTQIPIVDGNNEVALRDADGTKTILTDSSPAKKTTVTAVDVDGDGDQEVVFVHMDDSLAYVDDIGDSPAIEPLTDDAGNEITGIDEGRGVQ